MLWPLQSSAAVAGRSATWPHNQPTPVDMRTSGRGHAPGRQHRRGAKFYVGKGDIWIDYTRNDFDLSKFLQRQPPFGIFGHGINLLTSPPHQAYSPQTLLEGSDFPKDSTAIRGRDLGSCQSTYSTSKSGHLVLPPLNWKSLPQIAMHAIDISQTYHKLLTLQS